jgi:DNA repair exonuclease SbcCD ATPase subunit
VTNRKVSAPFCCAAALQAKVGEANAKLEAATQAQQRLQGQLEQSKQQLEAAKAQVEQLQQQLQKEQDDKVRCGDTLLGHLVPNMPTVMGAHIMP